jgi:hypothetical protein
MDPNLDTNNLIDNYERISLAEIRAFEEQYINNPIRPAQDNWMMYQSLMNSISKEGKDKITIWKNQYTIGQRTSGNLLLKIIVQESHLDTNATTASIRKKLSSLDVYILTINSDITKFNVHVSLLIDSLAARGETTQDLLTNLFKGYQAATDKTFVEYIGRKLERYEEGEMVTPDALVEQADNKFKLLKEGGFGTRPPNKKRRSWLYKNPSSRISRRENRTEARANQSQLSKAARSSSRRRHLPNNPKSRVGSIRNQRLTRCQNPKCGTTSLGTTAAKRLEASATSNTDATSQQTAKAGHTNSNQKKRQQNLKRKSTTSENSSWLKPIRQRSRSQTMRTWKIP